jgi:hypothetical protein
LGAQAGRSKILEIGNYGLQLEAAFSEAGATMWVRVVGGRDLEVEENTRLSLSGMSVAHPEVPWFGVPRTPDGTWHVAFESLSPGPYLAILRENENVLGRPRLVTVPGEQASDASEFVLAATDATESVRRQAWEGLCCRMAQDWNHTAWPTYRALIRTGRPLPASCFEAMQVAARHPEFLAQAMLREADPGGQREVLAEFEEAGVFWQALPFKAWATAIRCLRHWLRGKPELIAALGNWDKAMTALCPTVFGTTTPELRFLTVVRALCQSAFPELHGASDRCLSLPPAAIQSLLAMDVQAVCSRHADDEWPRPRLSDDLSSLSGELPYTDHPTYRHEILRAPYVAARLALRSQVLEHRDGCALRNARAFDPEWFDGAHAFHLAALIQRDRRTHEEMFGYE